MSDTSQQPNLSELSREELLASLRDIQLPDAPQQLSDWPIMLTLLMIVIALIVIVLPRNILRRTTSNEWLERLDRINCADDKQASFDMLLVLREYMLSKYPAGALRTDQADSFSANLNTHFNTEYFTNGLGKKLFAGRYEKTVALNSQELKELLQQLRILIRKQR